MKKIKSVEPTYGINWEILKRRLNISWKIIALILWIGLWGSVVLRCYDIGPLKM